MAAGRVAQQPFGPFWLHADARFSSQGTLRVTKAVLAVFAEHGRNHRSTAGSGNEGLDRPCIVAARVWWASGLLVLVLVRGLSTQIRYGPTADASAIASDRIEGEAQRPSAGP